MPHLFHAASASTDDADLDAELILLEDSPHTIEEIQALCRRYGVRGRAIENGRLVAEIDKSGTLTRP